VREIMKQLAEIAKQEGINRLVVGAIISRNQKVLCLKRAGSDFMPGLYELPSGKVESNELLDVALIREVFEESHLTVTQITKYLGHFDYQSKSGAMTRQLTFLVDVNPTDTVILHEKEHEGYTWLTENELANYKISAEVQSLIRNHFDFCRAKLSVPTSPTLFGKRGRDDQEDEQGEDKSGIPHKIPSLGHHAGDK
jgi:8-oxo-dGTP diphosphatase